MTKHSYIRKLFLMLGIIITAAVLLIGTAIFHYAKTEIENELFFLNQRSLKQIGQGTRIKLAEYNHLSSKIANDSQIITLLEQNQEKRDGEAIAGTAQAILDNYVWTYSEYNPLVYTYVMSMDEEIYASAYSRNKEMKPILEEIDYEAFLNQPEEFFFLGPVENKKAKGVYRYSFLMVRKIKDHITGQVYGWVILNISEKNLYESYKDLIGSNKNFYIADQEGTIISEKNKLRIGSFCGVNIREFMKEEETKLTISDVNGKEAYFLCYEIPQTGWYLVETLETSGLLESIGKIRWFIILVITLVTALLLFILKQFLKAISVPVMSIKEKMEEVADGNMQVQLSYEGNNEFGEMAKSFNYMVNQMTESMNAVKEEEKKKRLAEQEFLRAQINPHFIYNTLSSIRFFVEMNRNEEAQDMLFHFSRILRKSLSNAAEFVSIRTELDTIGEYVELQKKRYKNSFTVEYDVSEEILDNRIPVFILQPIVENAIFHGMVQGEVGKIFISGYEKADKVYIRITDNGRGMKSEQIDQLFLKAGHMSKVGIQNVRDRILLNFGEEYGLKVESTEGEGTMVLFILPVNKEG